MILKQYYLSCLAHASYLIADERTKTAAVVDPQPRYIQQYLDDAAAAGNTIRFVFLTHFHADFLAGHIELRNQAGAQICLGTRAAAEFEHLALKDGDDILLGDVRVRIDGSSRPYPGRYFTAGLRSDSQRSPNHTPC
ncbi:MAG UNVERIFIED_CONTAM: MBL fold metallo-hydrolase [Planctomycetaceae bacterium]